MGGVSGVEAFWALIFETHRYWCFPPKNLFPSSVPPKCNQEIKGQAVHGASLLKIFFRRLTA
jgi:hypothetical protein